MDFVFCKLGISHFLIQVCTTAKKGEKERDDRIEAGTAKANTSGGAD